jgi:hypothetical protein
MNFPISSIGLPNNLKYDLQDKLFIDLAKTNFYLPYYMIIVYAQLNLFIDGLIHFRIIFNKKNYK